MSVSIYAFTIDLASYRAVQGSGDLALAERISEQAADQIAADDAWFVRLRPDHLPIENALRDIVIGDLRDGRSAGLSYQVAALVLADYLGNRIDDEAIAEQPSFVQASIDRAISELLAAYGGETCDWPLLSDVLARGPALNIPWVRESLPNGTGVVAKAEARRAAETIARIPVQQDDDANELALVYGSWLTRAAQANLALLLACE